MASVGVVDRHRLEAARIAAVEVDPEASVAPRDLPTAGVPEAITFTSSVIVGELPPAPTQLSIEFNEMPIRHDE
jgi:hypothetical protein